MQPLPAKGYFQHTAEYDTKNWFVVLPEGVPYADLFRPDFWVHHASRMNQFELVRVRACDGSFDVTLCVRARAQGGVHMEEWPKWPSETAADEARAQQDASIKPREVAGKPVPRVEHTKATKWRVIGLDGNEFARNFDTKDIAEKALVNYAAGLGRVIEPA